MTERVKFGTLTVERSFLLSKAIRMWSTPCPSTTQSRASRLSITLSNSSVSSTGNQGGCDNNQVNLSIKKRNSLSLAKNCVLKKKVV